TLYAAAHLPSMKSRLGGVKRGNPHRCGSFRHKVTTSILRGVFSRIVYFQCDEASKGTRCGNFGDIIFGHFDVRHSHGG
ncbi:MAG: hypothetical protein WBW41_01815, partial [Verrucomicrobiia bacterium]